MSCIFPTKKTLTYEVGSENAKVNLTVRLCLGAVLKVDMARYGPFNNPQKIVGSCNLGNFGNFWQEMANSKIAKSVI